MASQIHLKHRSYSFWLTTLLASVLLVFSSQKYVSSLEIQSFKEAPISVFARQSRTDDVTFDNYSLLLKGKRVFLHSGEFHTFRLPVVDLWPDILEKTKAAGLNAISVYVHMGLTNPSRNVLDFDGWRALKPLFEAAMEAGVWIVLRPGPYINSETSAGGVAHWATAEVAGQLKTDAEDWREAWIPYIQGIIDEATPYQISQGGPIIAMQIDNEYNQTVGAEYFQDLIDFYRDSPIVVPLIYNDPGPRRNFINGTGAVDLYGMDAYPQRYDCSNPTQWHPVPLGYHDYHMEVNPWQPWYSPEFQGGSFDPWGPDSPGYEGCAELTGPDFENVFYQDLWASNMKLISYYMFYGGTSWGAIPFPGVYTSYDWGAAIAENRSLRTKYDELKLQGHFIRSTPDFYKTDWVGNTSIGAPDVSLSSVDAFATVLKNPDSGAGYYIVRQLDSTSTDTISFKLNVSTDEGSLQLPVVAFAITLSGRQSKVIVTSYAFGSSSLLEYSTAQIFFSGVLDGRDVLFLYGDSIQEHEASLALSGTPNPLPQQPLVISTKKDRTTVLSLLPGIQGLITIYDSDTQLILFADTDTAKTFWAPMLATSPSSSSDDPFRNFWDLSEDTPKTVLIGGPYLVRGVSLEENGTKLALRGDLKENNTLLTIIGAPHSVKRITWNNGPEIPNISLTNGTSIRLLSSASTEISLPKLENWKFKDSLPEIVDGYDDSAWVVANNTLTNSPKKPYYGDGRVLYGCDYHFCEGVVLWRGHFNASREEKSVNLSINGGTAFAASVWLNDVFLATTYGNSTNNRNIINETDKVYVFPDGALRAGEDNVITIVQDNMGLDETEGVTWNGDSLKSPRGVRGFQLDDGAGSSVFGEWKVQGKVGGYLNFPDKTRGIYNEGGLFGERKGWHLPGFDVSEWESRDSLGGSKAGVGFYVTEFDLDLPRGLDVMMSFTFEEQFGQAYRAFLFVNGWMMGKRVGNLGPQAKFPVHEGILDYRGINKVAVAIWNMEDGVPVSPDLQLTLDAVIDGGVGTIQLNNPGWSPDGRTLS